MELQAPPGGPPLRAPPDGKCVVLELKHMQSAYPGESENPRVSAHIFSLYVSFSLSLSGCVFVSSSERGCQSWDGLLMESCTCRSRHCRRGGLPGKDPGLEGRVSAQRGEVAQDWYCAVQS